MALSNRSSKENHRFLVETSPYFQARNTEAHMLLSPLSPLPDFQGRLSSRLLVVLSGRSRRWSPTVSSSPRRRRRGSTSTTRTSPCRSRRRRRRRPRRRPRRKQIGRGARPCRVGRPGWAVRGWGVAPAWPRGLGQGASVSGMKSRAV